MPRFCSSSLASLSSLSSRRRSSSARRPRLPRRSPLSIKCARSSFVVSWLLRRGLSANVAFRRRSATDARASGNSADAYDSVSRRAFGRRAARFRLSPGSAQPTRASPPAPPWLTTDAAATHPFLARAATLAPLAVTPARPRPTPTSPTTTSETLQDARPSDAPFRPSTSMALRIRTRSLRSRAGAGCRTLAIRPSCERRTRALGQDSASGACPGRGPTSRPRTTATSRTARCARPLSLSVTTCAPARRRLGRRAHEATARTSPSRRPSRSRRASRARRCGMSAHPARAGTAAATTATPGPTARPRRARAASFACRRSSPGRRSSSTFRRRLEGCRSSARAVAVARAASTRRSTCR